MSRLWFPCLLAGVLACSIAQAAPAPYVLEGTEVHDIHAAKLGRDYQLFVSLPLDYGQTSKRYPVLFVTDANYAFPLVRSITRRVGDHGRGLQDFILVGLSYGKGDTVDYSRRRDYTPSANGDRNAVSDMPGRQPAYGEADGYRRFIAEEVFPFIARQYRADMKRKIFVGHSYGSLLGVQILLTDPSMFEHYILGSPSLWFDKRIMFAREKAYAGTHKDLPAKVFMAAASYETPNPKSHDPRYSKDDDMIGDMRSFESALKSRHYPNLHIQSTVIKDEDHLTVFPAIVTRGLKWALPPG
ncbi:MAG TPA: alpha/beta hydrolase-fold protein [Telluria sp.]|nr:alpha/beta hydrolase-fold protein [Telluria sp.]